ncbi:MAG TPA: ABC transporter substrate-binding protein [Tepidiformaceae bacterium]|nr:ABC transporter substrate-binding protein [Tepidiformaceae bacterium]
MTGRETAPRGLSRRHFLGLAGAGGAALFAAACGGSKNGDGGLASLPSPSASRSPTRPSASPAPTRPGASGQHGEAMRVTGYVTRDSSLDPHKTQAGPFYGIQSLVFSRLIAYQNQVDGAIVADLARDLPEQPDATTFVFRLNGGAKWQERPPVNGRAVTPADVKASILRQKDGDRSFVRKARWSVVESVDTPDPQTIVVKLAAPMAAALGLFADVNAFVIPEELAAGAFTLDTQVGSGPFRWVEWQDGKFASVSRNPGWHGGNARPYLDGLTVVQPKDTDELEAGLRTKKLDAVFVGRPQAEKLKRAVPHLQETTVGHSMFYGMRFFEPQFPYNDVRFRNAVAAALDRRAMIQQWFAGSGDLNPWVSWPMTRWTLPQSELTNVAGYRPGAAGREQDIAEARALMAAFRSEKKLPDTDLPLFVPDDAEANLGLGSLIRQQLKAALDLNVAIYPLPIGDLVGRMLSGNAPWVAGPDNGWIDLDDWLYPYFHSSGTKNSFALRSTELDGLIDAQRKELDEGKRRAIGHDVQRRLLALNLGVNFVSERVVALAWPYVRGFPLDASDGYQHRFADAWIDRNDPSFRGR